MSEAEVTQVTPIQKSQENNGQKKGGKRNVDNKNRRSYQERAEARVALAKMPGSVVINSDNTEIHRYSSIIQQMNRQLSVLRHGVFSKYEPSDIQPYFDRIKELMEELEKLTMDICAFTDQKYYPILEKNKIKDKA